jgi:hypothetical protein
MSRGTKRGHAERTIAYGTRHHAASAVSQGLIRLVLRLSAVSRIASCRPIGPGSTAACLLAGRRHTPASGTALDMPPGTCTRQAAEIFVRHRVHTTAELVPHGRITVTNWGLGNKVRNGNFTMRSLSSAMTEENFGRRSAGRHRRISTRPPRSSAAGTPIRRRVPAPHVPATALDP